MIGIKRCLTLLLFVVVVVAAKKPPSYYDVLGLKENASLNDVKAAYRRLALEHHPDRNRGREEEAAEKFREINEAYEVLSDPKSRGDYDASRQYGDGTNGDGTSGNDHGGASSFSFRKRGGGRRGRIPRDPFAQFNDVFENDPFFADVFEKFDDFFPSSSFGRATFSSSSRSSSEELRSSRSSYTSSSTSTVYRNGHKTTTKRMEKDGNKIEETYVDGKLTERKVNGKNVGTGWISGY